MLLQLFNKGLSAQEIIFYLLIMLFAMTLSFSLHEFMHAAVAVWLGDNTPKYQGRLTLNPLAHIDPVGTVLLLLARFGWGKPVIFNPNYLSRFKSRRAMIILVNLAGVAGNFLLSFLCQIISVFITAFLGTSTMPIVVITTVLTYTSSFSMMLLAFNLIPIPPLDGFHVLQELLPYKIRSSEGYRKFERFSPMCIWILFILGSISNVSILSYIIEGISFPFTWVINTVCNGLYSLLV